MYNNVNIDKQYRKVKSKIMAGIALLALAACLLLVSVVRTVSSHSKSQHFNDILVTFDEDGSSRLSRISYLDVIGFYQVAQYGDDLGYYIAYDEDYYYMVSIREKDWDYFADQFDDKEWVRLWGYTREVPYELKAYAIESLNEDYPDQNFTTLDYEDIFGDLLLEARRESSVKGLGGLLSLNGGYLAGAFLAGLFGIILLLTGLSNKKGFSVLGDSQFGESQVLNEINSPTARWYDAAAAYLTDNYLVSVKDTVNAVRYNDIFWTYVTNHRTNGIHDYNYLNVATKDGKLFTCSNSATFGKKRREDTENLHNELIQELLNKNPEIRVGYTAENIEAFNETIKNKKNDVSDLQ